MTVELQARGVVVTDDAGVALVCAELGVDEGRAGGVLVDEPAENEFDTEIGRLPEFVGVWLLGTEFTADIF